MANKAPARTTGSAASLIWRQARKNKREKLLRYFVSALSLFDRDVFNSDGAVCVVSTTMIRHEGVVGFRRFGSSCI